MERRSRGEMVALAVAVVNEEPEPEVVESLIRVWIAPPDRLREERETSDLDWFGVRRGELWWQYDSHEGAVSNEDEPEAPSEPPRLRP